VLKRKEINSRDKLKNLTKELEILNNPDKTLRSVRSTLRTGNSKLKFNA